MEMAAHIPAVSSEDLAAKKKIADYSVLPDLWGKVAAARKRAICP
jgi:hypothetical protein